MKTNASPKTVVQAVEAVSKRNYEGNVVLRRTPEKMTKNVCRFTLKTLHADKPGSLTTKQGIKQTKADWQVHQDVMYEILRLDPRPHIYVDTIYGREYNKNPQPIEVHAENQDEQATTRKRRKKSKRSQPAAFVSPSPQSFAAPAVTNTDNVGRQNILNIVQAIKYIINNPSVLTEAQ
jgi:hypothetical protein